MIERLRSEVSDTNVNLDPFHLSIAINRDLKVLPYFEIERIHGRVRLRPVALIHLMKSNQLIKIERGEILDAKVFLSDLKWGRFKTNHFFEDNLLDYFFEGEDINPVLITFLSKKISFKSTKMTKDFLFLIGDKYFFLPLKGKNNFRIYKLHGDPDAKNKILSHLNAIDTNLAKGPLDIIYNLEGLGSGDELKQNIEEIYRFYFKKVRRGLEWKSDELLNLTIKSFERILLVLQQYDIYQEDLGILYELRDAVRYKKMEYFGLFSAPDDN